MYRFLKIICWPIVYLLYPAKLVGRKNIDKKKNYIFVCNHRSNLDIVLLIQYIHRTQYILGKKELFATKCKKRFFNSMHVIPIDRKNLDLTAIRTCLKKLQDKKTLTIFPEGTRNKTSDNLQEIKNGTAMFSIKSGVEILPIKIEKRPRIFCLNKITFGKPFDLNQFNGMKLTKEVLDDASKIITEKLENI